MHSLRTPHFLQGALLRPRFYRNAYRVKTFKFYSDSALGVSRHLCYLRNSVHSPFTIFPNLRSLFILRAHAEEDVSTLASMLLSPTLESLTLPFDLPLTQMDTLLCAAQSQCPHIRKLKTGLWTSDAISLAIMENLQDFSFSGRQLTQATLAHLANSLQLHTLALYGLESLSSWPSHRAPGSFASLTALSLTFLHNFDFDSIPRFLRSILSPLTSFRLALGANSPNVDLTNETIACLPRFQALRILEFIEWDQSFTDIQRSRSYRMDPLFDLLNLEELTIHCGGFALQVVDANIQTFGKSWPNLRAFTYLQSVSRVMNPAGLTLKALELFASHLPNLEYLVLDLDARTPLLLDVVPATSDIPIELYLMGSLIRDTDYGSVAAYVSAVYPHATLNTQDKIGDRPLARRPTQAFWKSVRELLPIMKQVRAQERQRMMEAS